MLSLVTGLQSPLARGVGLVLSHGSGVAEGRGEVNSFPMADQPPVFMVTVLIGYPGVQQ